MIKYIIIIKRKERGTLIIINNCLDHNQW